MRAVVAPDCGYASGDGDIAILVLSRHLIGMPISSARIEAPPVHKDSISVFGFGRCSLSPDATHRRSRLAGEVCPEADHPEKCFNEGIKGVYGGHFEAVASICPGDSGGPVYSSRGDLVGVVSASVMDGDDRTSDRTLFTRVDVWPQLFSAAHEISLGASPGELPPYGDCRGAMARASGR
ncbi:MAG: trypsin-like serine protease [Minicystis sp.]